LDGNIDKVYYESTPKDCQSDRVDNYSAVNPITLPRVNKVWQLCLEIVGMYVHGVSRLGSQKQEGVDI
jgi:hypothetical protein